ncbi:MAG: hypothetical protein ACE5EQ_09255 [Phycisphaerae bacterium]
MNRNVILLVVFFVLIAVSAFMWKARQGTETDPSLATSREIYTCPKCQEQFEMTLAESGAMLRSNPGIICPHCKEVGAQKEGAIISVIGFGSPAGEGDAAEEEEELPPTQVGGLSPVKH